MEPDKKPKGKNGKKPPEEPPERGPMPWGLDPRQMIELEALAQRWGFTGGIKQLKENMEEKGIKVQYFGRQAHIVRLQDVWDSFDGT